MSLAARSLQEASAVASAFMQDCKEPSFGTRIQRAVAATSIGEPVKWVYTQYHADQVTPAVYAFNSNKGYVLVSAEDDARAILGYSDEGYLDASNLPDNLLFWMQMYADELSTLNKCGKKKGKVLRRAGQRTTSEEYPAIDPILGNTIWGQGAPFNNMCPMIDEKRTVTGCAATALSQIMYSHKHPTHGTGSHSYTTSTRNINLSADFGATTYDWANMLPNYNGSYTDVQANAVATLMYHVGVAAEMDYNINGSGAISTFALVGLTNYFDYDKGIETLPKDFMQEEVILQRIAVDLQAGRPIYISGATVNEEGHAFVCDGMQSNGYLHINWGWNGYSDGYFALSALDPENQGVGGSASDLTFTERVNIHTGIMPDQGGQAMPLVTVDKLIRTSADTISKTSSINFSLEKFTSIGMATASGIVYYAIYDSLQQRAANVLIGSFELPTGYYYSDPIKISGINTTTLANGKYELEIVYVDTIEREHPILVKGLGRVRMPLTVTDSHFIFGESPKAEEQLRDISMADITNIDYTNVWEIDLYSSNFWGTTPSEKDVLIRLRVNSSSSTSAVGTYVLDTNNSGAVGTINAEIMYAVGYANACYQHTPTDMHLTIKLDESSKLVIEYYVVVNGVESKQSFYPRELNWYLHESSSGNYYFYHDYINYELAAALKASHALDLTQNLNHTNTTSMSYFVSGIISHMQNTPEQIAQYKNARLYISDDGTSNNQLYSFNTKWLKNTDFTIGNEIAVGDTVVILGQLQNYLGNTPEIIGYIYQCDKKGTITDVENSSIQGIVKIYDIFGREVDCKTSYDIRPFNVPQSGIYIIRTENSTNKIYINK